MPPTPAAFFAIGHEYKARDARDHFKDLLDAAESGGVAVINRDIPVVMVRRDSFDRLVALRAPLDVKAAVSDNQFAFWLEGVPVHAAASDLDAAEDEFLNALIDYADAWFETLRHAPNHAKNGDLALRVASLAGDREELRHAVFGD